MRILILNCRVGGFGISQAGCRLLVDEYDVPLAPIELMGTQGASPNLRYVYSYPDGALTAPYFELHRDDKALVRLARDYPHIAADTHCTFGEVSRPDATDYVIREYDGIEYAAERHEMWFSRRIVSQEEI